MRKVRPLLFLGLGDLGISACDAVYRELSSIHGSAIAPLCVALGVTSSSEIVNLRTAERSPLGFSLDTSETPESVTGNFATVASDDALLTKLSQRIDEELARVTYSELRTKIQSDFQCEISASVEWCIFAPVFDVVGSVTLFEVLRLFSDLKSYRGDRIGQLQAFLLLPGFSNRDLSEEQILNFESARSYATLAEISYLTANEGKLGELYNLGRLASSQPRFWVLNNRSEHYDIDSAEKLARPIARILDILYWQHSMTDSSFLTFSADRQFNTMGFSEIGMNRSETTRHLMRLFKSEVISRLFGDGSGNTGDPIIEHSVRDAFDGLGIAKWREVLSRLPGGARIDTEARVMIAKKIADFPNADTYVAALFDDFSAHLRSLDKMSRDLIVVASSFSDTFAERLSLVVANLCDALPLANNWEQEFSRKWAGSNGGFDYGLSAIKLDIYSYHDDWFEVPTLAADLRRASERLRTIEDELKALELGIVEFRNRRLTGYVTDPDQTLLVERRDSLRVEAKAAKEELQSLLARRIQVDALVDSEANRRHVFEKELARSDSTIKEAQVELLKVDEEYRAALQDEDEAISFARNRVRLMVPALLFFCLALPGLVSYLLTTELLVNGQFLSWWLRLALGSTFCFAGLAGYYYLHTVRPRLRQTKARVELANENLNHACSTLHKSLEKKARIIADYALWSSALRWFRSAEETSRTEIEKLKSFLAYFREETTRCTNELRDEDSFYSASTMVFENVAGADETHYLLQRNSQMWSAGIKQFIQSRRASEFYKSFVGGSQSCTEFEKDVKEFVMQSLHTYFEEGITDYFANLPDSRFSSKWQAKILRRLLGPETFLDVLDTGSGKTKRLAYYLGVRGESSQLLLSKLAAGDLLNAKRFDPGSADNLVVFCFTSGFSVTDIAPLREYHRSYHRSLQTGSVPHIEQFPEPLPSILYELQIPVDRLKSGDHLLLLLLRFLEIARFSGVEATAGDASVEPEIRLYSLEVRDGKRSETIILRRTVDDVWMGLNTLSESAKKALCLQVGKKLEKYDQPGSEERIRRSLQERPRFSRSEQRVLSRFVPQMARSRDRLTGGESWAELERITRDRAGE